MKTYLELVAIGFLLYTFSEVQARSGYAILEARSADLTRKLSTCVVYNSEHQSLAADIQVATFHHLVDFSNVEGCSRNDFGNRTSLGNSAVAVARGNCTFIQKAQVAEAMGGAAVIVLDYKNASRPTYPSGNASEFKSINISLIIITFADYRSVLNLSDSVSVAVYAPSSPLWDANMVVMIVFSTLLVVVGAGWSAFNEWQSRRGSRRQPSSSAQVDDSEVTAQEGEAEISVLGIIIWFLLICGMILLLYFFYDYVVYFFIAIFCIAGSYSLYKCLLPVWTRLLPVHYDIPVNRLPCIRSKVKLKSFLLLMPCLTIGIFWAVERHTRICVEDSHCESPRSAFR